MFFEPTHDTGIIYSFLFQEPRFRERMPDTPGPGTYSTDLQWIKPRSMPLPEEQLFEGTGEGYKYLIINNFQKLEYSHTVHDVSILSF